MMLKKFIILSIAICAVQWADALPFPSYFPQQGSIFRYYPFNGNVIDSASAVGLDGTIHNNVTLTTDRYGNLDQAYEFDGNGGYIGFGDDDDVDVALFSVSFWFNPYDLGGNASEQEYAPLLSKWDNDSNPMNDFLMIYLDGSNLVIKVSEETFINTEIVPVNIPTNQWMHFAMAKHDTYFRVYLNGEIVWTGAWAWQNNFNSSELKLGNWKNDIDPNYSTFHGKLDEVIYWYNPLYDCDVVDLYTGQSNLLTNTLSIVGDDIVADESSATSYSWYDCDANQIIAGQTSQVFTPSYSSSYSVQVSMYACQQTSDCIYFEYVGIEENERPKIKTYPNPIEPGEMLFIDGLVNESYRITNQLGQTIQEGLYNNGIRVDEIGKGIYHLIIEFDQGPHSTPLIVN